MTKKATAVPPKERPPGAGKRGPIPGEGGAPKKLPTPEQIQQVGRIASIGGTHWEMAIVLGIDEDTFRARLKDTPELRAAVEQGLWQLRTSLRRKTIAIAMDDGHAAQATMLIWANKTVLGQTERLSVRVESEKDALAALQNLFPDVNLAPLQA